eukprot:CAMPEP_0167763396 /NCGR_PEP_ID=MMETSP0110_2-20121227/13344_1 /TAXON_ID=629695 /ORGANISM="Gymnochlora sp., Strain CCMP2014" /LENGTH=227 /DNA_ID=CAMNT_0007650465 /DNA_START=143 /DNA_END=823 /DNA_ORIENTATION=+
MKILRSSSPCEVVLSSNWKRTPHHRERVQFELKKAGWERGYIDVTKDRTPHRQEQIADWLFTHRDRVRSFVIIDDIDVSRHFRHRKFIRHFCVKTSPGIGLTAGDAKKAIEILRKTAEIPKAKVSSTASQITDTTSQKDKKLPEVPPEETPALRKKFVEDSQKLFERLSRKPKLEQSSNSSFSGKIVERFSDKTSNDSKLSKKDDSKNTKSKRKISRFKAARMAARR